MKGMAMQEFSAQLRRWALEQTRRDRGGDPTWPAAVARMAVFNDEADPDWRFPPWRVNIGGRQFPQREVNGFFVQGQVYKKDALLKAIPESYRRQPTQDDVMAAFGRNALAAFKKDKAAFIAKCGFFEFSLLGTKDLVSFPDPINSSFPKKLESFVVGARGIDVGKVQKEWKSLNKDLASTLRGSSICNAFMKGRIVTTEVVTQRPVTNMVVTTLAEASQAVTNWVATTILVTNRTELVVRDESDRAFLSAGLLRREPKPLTFAPALPAADASVETLHVSLRDAPTDPRLWKALAARYAADGKPAYSLSCLLNVLALTPSDTDIVVEIALRYADLGCPELARGAALLAYGTARDETTRGKVKPLLIR